MSVAVNNYTVAGSLTVSGSTALASSLISSSTATFSEVTATTLASTNCNTTTLSVGGNALFSVPPTCSVLATTASQLTNKAYVDGFSTLAKTNIWTGASNTFGLVNISTLNATGASSFNNSLPTSVQTPTTGSQLVTKSYTDTAISEQIATLKSTSNTYTGTNSYSGINSFGNSISLNDSRLLLRSSNDANHYVAFNSSINGVTIAGYNGISFGNIVNPMAIKVNSSLEVNLPSVFGYLPTCDVVPSTANQLVNKTYADNVKSGLLAGTNAWTGTNTFNTNLPTSTLTPLTATQLVTKTYADTIKPELLAGTNAWTGTNTFNSSLPTSTLIPSIANQLVNKTYADTIKPALLAGTNVWTGTNSFSFLPTCDVVPSTANQLVNKTYADTIKPALLAGTNAWTGTNTFNSSLPTSTLTPSAATQLVTKTYADSLITTLKSSVNSWTSISNQFVNLYATYFNVGSIDCTATVAAASISVTGDSNLTRIHGLKGFYSNSNHEPGTRFVQPTYIRLTTGPGAWLCNGGGGAFPVLGSINALSAYSAIDIEDTVLVMPGFKLVLYVNDFFTGQSATFDNTEGSVVRYYAINSPNNASSCKLFYLDQNTSNLNEMNGPYSGGTISYV